MAKRPKLKVFTAPIGFHDVYVAAPSRAAALRAWGSDHDLFARGLASEVTDAELMKEPLGKPGEVIRRLRGTEAEQFAALPADEKLKAKRRSSHTAAPERPPRPSISRPSRKALDKAEAALATAEKRHRAQDADAKARVEEAQRDRRDLQRRNNAEARELTQARDDARDQYERAVERWQESD